jgi:hypothetical protein
VPASVPKTARRVPQISIAHDIIAIEHAAGLVAAQFRGHALRNAGPDHVADGRSPEFVRDAARSSSLPLNLVSDGALLFQKLVQFWGQVIVATVDQSGKWYGNEYLKLYRQITSNQLGSLVAVPAGSPVERGTSLSTAIYY